MSVREAELSSAGQPMAVTSTRGLGIDRSAEFSGAIVTPEAINDSTAKRALDVTGALIGLLLLMPLLLIIAIAIKATSRGPVLFRQNRYGLGGKTFEIFKFRTMRVEQSDPSGVAFTQAGDARVTSVGRVLRRMSLDELPQLLNVLRGEMSLVGPRPHVPGMLAGGQLYKVLVPEYFERCRVRPGITGLAQACRLRGAAVDADLARARVAHDLAYIANWSLKLDLLIIWATISNECRGGSGI